MSTQHNTVKLQLIGTCFHFPGEQQVNAIAQNNANILILHTFVQWMYFLKKLKKYICILVKHQYLFLHIPRTQRQLHLPGRRCHRDRRGWRVSYSWCYPWRDHRPWGLIPAGSYRVGPCAMPPPCQGVHNPVDQIHMARDVAPQTDPTKKHQIRFKCRITFPNHLTFHRYPLCTPQVYPEHIPVPLNTYRYFCQKTTMPSVN